MRRDLFVRLIAAFFMISTGPVWGDLTDGLIGYWPLDGDGLDEWENGIDGFINGDVMPTEDRFGNADAALLFPGSPESHVDLGDHELFNISGAMTLAAWVTLDPDNGTRNGRIVAKRGGRGSRSWSLNIENAGVPATFQISLDGNNSRIIGDLDPLPQGKWVHLAGVYRPGESMELYLDGELLVIEEFDIPDEQYSANGLPVLIGSRNGCGDCGWFGAIDEVAIWARDLDEDEVLQAMESESLLDGPEVPAAAEFRRGDPDNSGAANITDAVNVLEFLFGGRGSLGCEEAGDVDNNGELSITDAVRLLNYLFSNGQVPEAPGPDTCGPDPDDALPKKDDGTTRGCQDYSSC